MYLCIVCLTRHQPHLGMEMHEALLCADSFQIPIDAIVALNPVQCIAVKMLMASA